jgi:predicted PurR-regulated permease PerM
LSSLTSTWRTRHSAHPLLTPKPAAIDTSAGLGHASRGAWASTAGSLSRLDITAESICMTKDRTIQTMLGLSTAILIFAALYLARSILAPVAFALFIIAIAWPFQKALQARLSKLVALPITLLVTVTVVVALGSLVVWGFGKIAQSLINDAARFQAIYTQTAAWLEQHDIYIGSVVAEQVNVGRIIGIAREVSGRIQILISFALVTIIFTILGLLEVDVARRKLESLGDGDGGQKLLRATTEIAAKLQKYMLVRSLMSVTTGIVVWGFASLVGLELATAWGVITFALNYIPFIGPLVATVFPTLFAVAQFGSWQMAATIFLCLNVIQFFSGSYLEPRIAGAALSLSPFMVLFAVFFWSFLWGIPGAFIGIPILIALHTLCEQYLSTRWIAVVLSGDGSRSTPRGLES